MGETTETSRLGTRLLSERMRLGAETGTQVSRRKIAELLAERGVHKSEDTVGNWERGRAQVPAEVLPELAEIFGVPEGELLELHLADHYDDSNLQLRLGSAQEAAARKAAANAKTSQTESAPSVVDRPFGRTFDRSWTGPVLGVLAAAAFVAGALWFSRTPSPTETAESPDRAVQRHDWIEAYAEGEKLWRKRFPGTRTPVRAEPLLVDVDRDGRSEVLANVRPDDLHAASGRLVCLSSTGDIIWTFEYGRPVSRGDRDFLIYQGVDPVRLESGPYILTNARHSTWYPTQIALLDPATGTVVSEYWHPGYLQSTLTYDLDGDGSEELLLGGINNPESGPGQPSLAVLDLPFATDPEHRGFFGETPTKVRDYLLLPRPDVFEVDEDLVVVFKLWAEGHVIHAGVGATNRWILDFAFTPNLELEDIYVSDTYVQLHDLQYQAGYLDHRFDPAEVEELRQIGRFETTPDGNRWSPDDSTD